MNVAEDKPLILTLGRWFRRNLGYPLRKLSVDAGFTCPNRDGTLSSGGCTFCDNRSFAVGTRLAGLSITEQVSRQREQILQRHPGTRFLVYFQANTNTYAPVEVLRARYDQALTVAGDIDGLAVGTRPDCLDDAAVHLLRSYAGAGRHVWVELGLQSIHDHLHADLNRAYGVQAFDDAVHRLAAGHPLHVCAHLIFGLPGESWRHMMETVEHVAALPVAGVKFHHLHVVRGTPLEARYRRERFPLPAIDAYSGWVADAIQRLRLDMAVQRVCGEAPAEMLVEPSWSCASRRMLGIIERRLVQRGTRQGTDWLPHGPVHPHGQRPASL